MFNLDEEFSDDERAQEDEEEATGGDKAQDKDGLDKNENVDKKTTQGSPKDLPLSASLKKSISDIDQQFAWVKKKRNTKKYLVQDFDIKNEFRRNASVDHGDEGDLSKSRSFIVQVGPV